jgi:hypothetical protein
MTGIPWRLMISQKTADRAGGSFRLHDFRANPKAVSSPKRPLGSLQPFSGIPNLPAGSASSCAADLDVAIFQEFEDHYLAYQAATCARPSRDYHSEEPHPSVPSRSFSSRPLARLRSLWREESGEGMSATPQSGSLDEPCWVCSRLSSGRVFLVRRLSDSDLGCMLRQGPSSLG